MYEPMSESEVELAEEEEGMLMQMQLLQKVQVQQRSSSVASSEKEITSVGQHVTADDESRSAKANRTDASSSSNHNLVAQVVPGDGGDVKSPPGISAGELVDTFVKKASAIQTISHQGPPLRLLHGAVIGVFLIAVVVQLLVCFGVVGKFPKPFLFRGRASKTNSVRDFVHKLSTSSALDVETYLPAAGGSDEKFLQPLATKGPIRLEVKIEGTFDRSAIQAPLTQRDCVLYSAIATRHGENKKIASSAKHSHFIASMVDAPWVKVLVASNDVVCFDMCSGLWSHSGSLAEAPQELKAFVAEHRNLDCLVGGPEKDSDAKEIDFEERSLLVGSIVTLVGKLCRGPGGELALQRWQDAASKATSGCNWFGSILASDDSSLHGRVVAGGVAQNYGTL